MKEIVKRNIAIGWMQRNVHKYYDNLFEQVNVGLLLKDVVDFVEADQNIDWYEKIAAEIADRYNQTRKRSLAR